VGEPTIKSVPAALISYTGASFYVLEGFDDFLDDAGNILNPWIAMDEVEYESDRNRRPNREGVYWMGEQALDLVLRYGLSRRQVKLICHSDFQPASGHLVDLTLFSTEPQPDRRGVTPPLRIGFRLRLKATAAKNPSLVALDWEVEKLTDGPAPEEGAKFGQFPRTAERIHVGSGVIPVCGTLLWFHREQDHRGYYVLLRVSSLREP